MAQMSTCLLIPKNVGKKNPLVDLEAVLVPLHTAGLGGDLWSRRRKPGDRFGRRKYELLDADETGRIPRQLGINRSGMPTQEALACLARLLANRVGHGCLRRTARGLFG